MNILISLILNTLAVFVAAYIVPGVVVAGFFTAAIVSIVLGVINTFLKPILVLLTLPINLLTLGLFTLVINAVLVLIAASVVPGFMVEGFLSALIFSIVLSLVNGFLGMFESK